MMEPMAPESAAQEEAKSPLYPPPISPREPQQNAGVLPAPCAQFVNIELEEVYPAPQGTLHVTQRSLEEIHQERRRRQRIQIIVIAVVAAVIVTVAIVPFAVALSRGNAVPRADASNTSRHATLRRDLQSLPSEADPAPDTTTAAPTDANPAPKRHASARRLLITSESETVNFVVVGDWNADPEVEPELRATMARYCARYGCDFVASVGNDYDPDTLQGIPPAITQQRGHLYYDVYMDGSQVPFYALIGDKYKEKFADVDDGKHYHSVDTVSSNSTVHIQLLLLDTGGFIDDPTFAGDQLDWMRTTLDAGCTYNLTQVALGHHPITAAQSERFPVVGKLRTVLEAYGVQAYLSGRLQMSREGDTIFAGVGGPQEDPREGDVDLDGAEGFLFVQVTPHTVAVTLLSQFGDLVRTQVVPLVPPTCPLA